MSRLAFFAPLKSPHHNTPSGDRELAAGVLAALSMNAMGFAVDLASELRCYDGKGDALQQKRLLALADAEIDRLLQDPRSARWRAWVSYHNYYKAPDLLGPRISQALGIPYILLEASRSQGRLSGSWATFAERAETACDQAAVIFYLTERDRVALEQHRHEQQKIVHFAPFLNQLRLPEPTQHTHTDPVMLAVGMHRKGDKLASYNVIAELLPYLSTSQWRLQIVGDGPAHAQVRTLFAPFAEQVCFLGQLDRQALGQLYDAASVFVWPGVNEAFGMVYLEAQAHGLPVVAEDRPGVREVVASQQTLVPQASPEKFAHTLDRILGSASLRSSLSAQSRQFVSNHHLLDGAAEALSDQLERLLR